MTFAVASSSKRPLPSTLTAPTPAKRPRSSPAKAAPSVVDSLEDEEDDDIEVEIGENADDATKAKVARKEARIIRNRESAQRSRNQRKAHLVWLESRVAELEDENERLRGESSTSAISTTTTEDREPSPTHSVVSFANDLGIPSAVFNSGGINLAAVAPPPADLVVEDIKPIINSRPFSSELVTLQSENASLRAQVSQLENLVKQIVAVSAFGNVPSVPVAEPVPTLDTTVNSNVDWTSFFAPSLAAPATNVAPSSSGLSATLSPNLFPIDAPSSNTHISSTLPTPSDSFDIITPTLARHPAAGEDNTGADIRFEFGGEQGAAGAGGPGGLSDCGFAGVVAQNYIGTGTGLDLSFGGVEEAGPVPLYGADAAASGLDVESWDAGMKELLERLEQAKGGASGGEAMGGSGGEALSMGQGIGMVEQSALFGEWNWDSVVV